jgi:hypothetical protein
VEPIQIMIDDLGRQVAQKAVEVAEWKARALVAEGTLATIRAEAEDEDETGAVLELVTDDGGSQDDKA